MLFQNVLIMKDMTVVFLLLALMTNLLYGQEEQTVFGKNGMRISGVWVGPAVSVGKVDGEPLVFRGGYGGLEFGKRLFIGWGSFETDNDVHLDVLDNDRFIMDYSGFILGYTLNSYKTLHSGISVMTGSGNAQLGESEKDNIFVFQPGIGVELNVFRWFHLSLDAGYRLVTNVNIPGMTDRKMSGSYAELKMKFGFSW